MAETVTVMTHANADTNVTTKLATNHNRETQNEQHRDALRNVHKAVTSCYGGMRNLPAAPQTFALAGSFVDLKPWSNQVPTDTLTLSLANGTVTIPAAAAGIYKISWSSVVQIPDVPGTTGIVTIHLLQNATEIDIIQEHVTQASGPEQPRFLGGDTIVTLAGGDVLKLQIHHAAASLVWLGAQMVFQRIA